MPLSNPPTQQEIDDFLNQPDIVFESTNSKQSFKSNLLIIKRNFDKLKIYLSTFHFFIKYLYNLIDVETITNNVINNLFVNKSNCTILSTTAVGEVKIDGIFKITRETEQKVKIERQLNANTWNVDNIIIQVKNVDGQVMYPTIVTKNNKIEIFFVDEITSNYKVLFL